MAFDTTEAVAKFLSGFQMKITNRERDTVAPDYYVKYSLTLSKGGKDFSTTFVSDPRASGEPTVTQVFSALADDALTLRKYSTDEFVDKLYAQGVKPSAALRAYDSCKETNLWMQDELYLSGWEIEEISKILTKYEDEVNTLVEKAASERAARYAYDHPKLPKGFVTIEQLQGDLDLGDLRDEVEDFDFDGDITEAFGETAEYKVDDNYHALLTWLPDHTEWLEEAEFDGLLEGCKGDIYKMVQMAQYVYFKSDLYDHCEDICRYGTLDQLRDMGVYAIRESLADEILNDLSYDEDYAPTDDAKDIIMGAVSAAFEERYGEDFAEVATDFRQDFTDDEIFNHQMEMKDFDYEKEMRALAAFFNGEKSDMSDFVNPYGGNHILVSGSVGRWNGTSTGIAVYKDFDAATDCSPSRFGQGNVFADCEIQKVWDENGTLYLAGAHHDGRVSVEMRQLTDEGERLWDELNAYSGAPAAAHRASYPLVEFYDTSQDAARFPGGQFVSRYYMTDLLEDNSIAVSLDTMLKNGNQFSLDGGIPAWTVEGDDLAKVNDFLKKSCMEFCGSLPGDEKDEDGYSLSGEAKDATASRNGLSRNQMGIEEKAAECKEAATVLANGNAL